MHRLKEFVEAAKTRVSGDAVRVSVALATSSGPIIAVTQSVLTATAYEALKHEDLRPIGLMCMAAITLASNATSLYLEAKALRERKYSNSPIPTGANALVNRPGLVAVGSHIYHMAVLGLFNPVHLITASNLLSGKPIGDLAIVNGMAVSTTSASWKILTNSLIISDRIKPLANVLEKANNRVISVVKPVVDRAKNVTRSYFEV